MNDRSRHRHCEALRAEAIQNLTRDSGLLRGARHRAALRADPLARNDVASSCFFRALKHQHTVIPPISFADHVKLSRETAGKTLP
jgi:hypothetical protein